MAAHRETRLVPYPADLMYAVVADVERYPEFLPWCSALRVLSRAKDGEREIVMAEMLVGFKALRERYTSRVVLDAQARTISVIADRRRLQISQERLALHAGGRGLPHRFFD